MAPNITTPLSGGLAFTRGNFVLLRAGTLRLLLPQSHVGAAEYLQHTPQPSGTPGLLKSRDAADARVFAALSDNMRLLSECPPERFVACRLERVQHDIVWCWDELRVLIDLRVDAIALPPALLTANSPVQAYAELDGAPAFLCTADALARFSMPELETNHAA